MRGVESLKHKVPGILALIVAAAVLYVFAAPSYRQGEPSLAGRRAKDFALQYEGRPARLSDLHGKVVLVNFWASWCPPCRAEARVLEEAWRKYKDDGLVFLGINTQDTEEAARKFLEEYSITYPNGQDPGGRIAIDYGTWGLPESFFIDAAGQITYKHVGAIGWDTLLAKVEEARRGVVSAGEGRGEYQSSR